MYDYVYRELQLLFKPTMWTGVLLTLAHMGIVDGR